jgi:DNA-binding MarR family transcriptional regulator
MKLKMTPRRKSVLDAFKTLEKASDIPPSLSEVAEVLDITPSTVHEHVVVLHGAGLLRRTQFGGTKEFPYFKYHVAERCPTCGATKA